MKNFGIQEILKGTFLAVLAVAVLGLLSSCSQGLQQAEEFATSTVQELVAPTAVVETSRGDVVFTVEVVEEEEERRLGLMYRRDLEPDQGMVFLFEEPGMLSFWMKNTVIPLDILFLDEELRILNISENTPPCTEDPCPVYRSERAAKYVLEIPGGQSAERGIMPGDRVRLLTAEGKVMVSGEKE